MLSGCSYADVAKLVYAIDLGSIGRPCRFESCHPHQGTVAKRKFCSSPLFAFRDSFRLHLKGEE